jgi:hypothetical protein
MEENGVSMGGNVTTNGMQKLKLSKLAVFEWIGVL